VRDHDEESFADGTPLPPPEEPPGGPGKGPSQAQLLMAMAENTYRLIRSADGRAYAVPKMGPQALVPDLITALCAATAEVSTVCGMPPAPALTAFHVGITRVEGECIKGPAVTRIRDLLRELAPAVASGEVPAGVLMVGISVGLFDDIAGDCDFSEGWIPLTTALAWCRAY